jgi:hypothetical protein
MLTTVLAGALKVRVTQNCGFDGVLPWMWLEPVKLYIHTWLYQVVDRSQASLPALRKEARVLLNLSAGEASGMLKADLLGAFLAHDNTHQAIQDPFATSGPLGVQYNTLAHSNAASLMSQYGVRYPTELLELKRNELESLCEQTGFPPVQLRQLERGLLSAVQMECPAAIESQACVSCAVYCLLLIMIFCRAPTSNQVSSNQAPSNQASTVCARASNYAHKVLTRATR